MDDKTTITIKIDRKVKEELKEIFKDYGYSISEATHIFYNEVLKIKDFPFIVRTNRYSPETLKAIDDAINDVDPREQYTLEEFIEYYENLSIEDE